MQTIEYKLCAWEGCGKQFIPQHGNQKYCSNDCYLAAKRKRERERVRNKRNDTMLSVGQKSHRQHKSSVGNSDARRPMPPTALALYDQEVKKRELIHLIQEASAPLTTAIENRIVLHFNETNDRIHMLETEVKELKHALPLTPALAKKHPWREWAIRKAMQILEVYQDTPLGAYQNKYRLVERIQEALACTKRTATELMKQAEKRLQRSQRDPGQGSMEDW